MFEKALAENREAIYAILSSSPLPSNAITPSLGSAFMVAPGMLVTTARCLRNESAPGGTPHEGLRVIRAPDIGKKPEPAFVLAADDRLDLALLRIDSPRSSACVRLLDAPVPWARIAAPPAFRGSSSKGPRPPGSRSWSCSRERTFPPM